MRHSARAGLGASVAAATAIAFAVVPSAPEPAPPSDTVRISAPVQLAAAVEPLPVAELPTLLGDWLPRAIVSPNAAAPLPPVPGPIVGATSLGNAVLNAWNWALPWIDYGVELADYVLGFLPFGYLIGDQIGIVYFSLVRPVSNSFVVDLVAPVLNDPLNPAAYVDGLVTLGSVTVASLINLGISEFNYFFGWLIPPLPPLPLRPFGAEAAEVTGPEVAEIEADADEGGTTEAPEKSADSSLPPTDDLPKEMQTPGDEIVDAEKGADDADPTAEKQPTTDTTGTVSAQGEVRVSAEVTEEAPATEATETSDADDGAAPITDVVTEEAATAGVPPSPGDDAAGSDGEDGAPAAE